MKEKYLIRLDDACHDMAIDKWSQIEDLLDKYSIKPIVAVIPDNKDEKLVFDQYDNQFYNYKDTYLANTLQRV